MNDLENRVTQFNLHELPGQPMASHMGTVYLVNDLWREVKLGRQLAAEIIGRDTNKECRFCSKTEWGEEKHDRECPLVMAYEIAKKEGL